MFHDYDISVSAPKMLNIYKLNSVNINFHDLLLMTPDETIHCNPKKLEKGQNINLQKTPKNAVKFKNIKYMAVFFNSDAENTCINGITYNGKGEIEDSTNTDDVKAEHQILEFECMGNVTKCICVHRTIDRLIYYQLLDMNNVSDQDHLMRYVDESK
eukprot:540222_1